MTSFKEFYCIIENKSTFSLTVKIKCDSVSKIFSEVTEYKKQVNIQDVKLTMETKKSILTVRIPKELNKKFTEYSRKRGLAKNAILITLIEELVKIPTSETTTTGNK